MTINVSEAIDSETGEIATVQRMGVPVLVDGIYRKPEPSTFKCLISMQQPTPRQLESLPEAERTNDVMQFIANKTIRTADEKGGTPADVIIRRGNKYKVIQAADWEVYGHTTGFCARRK